MSSLLKKCFKLLAISAMLMQHLQPVAVLAERRIVIYENQTGPYYQVDVTGNEIVNTPESEEENNIIIEETQEMESVENQEEESLVKPEATVLPELELNPENTEAPIEMEQPVLTEEPVEQEVTLEPDVEQPLEPTNTPEVEIEQTDEPAIDEKIETTEIPEIIETAPIEFKEISSEFVVEVEEGFEFEQAIDEYTSVYTSIEEEGLKQLVIGESPINAQVNQNFEPISLELNESTSSTYSLRNNTGWLNTNNAIQSAYPVDPADGITFTVRGRSLTLKSMLNSAGQPVLQDNQIIYPMEGNVNLRYVIQPGLISEDIMIYNSEASSTYSYEVAFESGRIASSENVIAVIDENEELLMHITAPVAYDAAGAETEVTLTYEDGIVSVSVDEAWMKSKERVYPIVIDPEYSYGYNSSVGFETTVTSTAPNTRIGALNMGDYNWTLPSNMLNHAYVYLGDTSSYKDSYSFYKVLHEHNGYQSLYGKYIQKAELVLSSGEINMDNVIIVSKINQTFDLYTVTYNSRPTNLTELSRTPITAGQWSVAMDITEYMQGIFEAGVANNSIMLQLENQRGSAKFHAYEYYCYDKKGWYTPYVQVTYWDEPGVEMTDVNDFTFTLRPFTVSSYEEGIITFTGLGIDGTAPNGSTINVSVTEGDTSVASQSVDVTTPFYRYPDYTEVTGAQSYNDTKTSNYQSTVMNGFEAGKLYTVSLQATDGTMTSTIKTETFQLVEIKNFDVITSVAEYYGVTAEQLVADNNMTDELVTAGNLIIVRNPQNHAGEDYVVDDC